LYALTPSNINRFSQLFHFQNQEKICNNTITKDPTKPHICRYTTLWMSAFHWPRHWSVASPAWVRRPAARRTHRTCKNCRIWQLAYFRQLTETTNRLFPVVNFLKYVVTEVILFLIVAFKTLDIYKVV